MKSLYICVSFAIFGLSKAASLASCKGADQACIDKNINGIYQKIMEGVPELGIEPQNPLYIDLIEGDLSILKYKFFNSTFERMKNCKINKFKVEPSKKQIRFEFVCPDIEFYGKYDIDGRLILLPVQGKGDYNMKTGIYTNDVECDYQSVDGSDGKKHLNIKNFKILQTTAVTAINYRLDNLFNGQKDLGDAVLKFANENWKEVADFVQGPVWNAIVKKIISNENKFMKSIPYDEMVPALGL